MTLFVGHINERIKDQTLHELFSPYGMISIIDRKGTYAFVEYEGPADTDRAVQELNKLEIMGTVLRVELSNRIRGELGPPPGDRSELCYNCLKVGHIAKNCLLPPQIMIQRQQQQQLLQSSSFHLLQPPPPPPVPFIPTPGPSMANRQPHQSSRLSRREGFLDRNPQKVRLNKLGSPRMRMNPYSHPGHSGPSKKDAMWPQAPGMYSSLSPQSETSPRQTQKRRKSANDNNQHSLESMVAMGMQSSSAQGITQMAAQPASHYPSSPRAISPKSPKGKHPQVHAHSPESFEMGPYSALPQQAVNPSSSASAKQTFYPRSEYTDMASPHHPGHSQGASNAPHSYIHPANAQLVENPFLPPGTLIYMPMITVLPGTQARQQQQQQSQQRNFRPSFQSHAPPPHQHRSLSAANVNTPFSLTSPRPLTLNAQKRHSLQSHVVRDHSPPPTGVRNKPNSPDSTLTHGDSVMLSPALQQGADDSNNSDEDPIKDQTTSTKALSASKDKT